MTLREFPLPGELWQHWKHYANGAKYQYRILTVTLHEAIAQPLGQAVVSSIIVNDADHERDLILKYRNDYPGLFWLKDTEGTVSNERYVISEGAVINERYVIYKSTDAGVIWARSIVDFMAEDDRSPNGWKFIRILE